MEDPRRPPPAAGPPADALDERVRLAWRLLAAALAALAATLVARLVVAAAVLDAAAFVAMGAAAVAAAFARRAVERRDARRREELANVTRVLGGFSRAVSPDAIVEAILGELGGGTGADHLVVVRRRPGAPILDATLVPVRPGARRASAVLPAVDLDDLPSGDGAGVSSPASAPAGAAPAGAPQDAAARAAERIAARVRRAFGLQDVLAAPLVAHGELLGAIVISRRRAGPWPAPTRRLLEGAAREASAALDRTLSLQAAEAAATTDPLTGLPNRRYVDEVVALLGPGRRAEDAMGVVMVDVDHFKRLNDRHGHAVGDDVLRAVARTIAAAVRDVDVPARYGGEEFVVLLRRPGRAVALEVGERIRAAVQRLDLRDLGVDRVTVSVGVAVGIGDGDRVGDLLVAADRALYRAKRNGRNRVEAD
jgi:diguanylate cyclase (GGDEF)-like protein